MAAMETLACIQSRYSCRDYLPTPVPRELLERLIDAGRRAPSGRKEEPVEFVVVTDQATRQYMADFTNYGKFLAVAGACIVVIARDVTYCLEDGCAAAENILLAATDLGLQSCWVAGDKKPYARQILDRLGVPSGYKLITMLAIGYGREPGRQPEHKPLDRALHWEQFK
jgi:nitroreductase